MFRTLLAPAAMLTVGLLSFAFPLLGRAEPAEREAPLLPPSPLPLAWCLARAEVASPQIAVAAAEAAAARERIAPAGALEDPRLRYEASNVPVDDLDFNSTPLSGNQFTLSQKLPFPGLLGSREEAARAGAQASEATLEDRRLQIAARVEEAWATLGFAQRALVITERNIELLRQLARIAEAKYQVGSGLQQDVLRAQVELTQLLDQRLQRVASLEAREARLAALLDLPPRTPLPETTALEETAPVPPLAPLWERLEAESPVLTSLAARVQQAEQQARVARLEGYPDVDLGLGYRVRRRAVGDPVDGDDFLMAGVTVRLPWNRSKWRARVAEQEALARRARAARRAARADLRDALRARHAALARADAEVSLIETGLLPQSRQSLEASRAGYEVDEVDFLSLIDSQVSLLEAELQLVRARADRRAAFAALEAVVGEAFR